MEDVEAMAKAHWEYVRQTLATHILEDARDISQHECLVLCGYHYISAFIHGYKHGVEFTQKGTT